MLTPLEVVLPLILCPLLCSVIYGYFYNHKNTSMFKKVLKYSFINPGYPFDFTAKMHLSPFPILQMYTMYTHCDTMSSKTTLKAYKNKTNHPISSNSHPSTTITIHTTKAPNEHITFGCMQHYEKCQKNAEWSEHP